MHFIDEENIVIYQDFDCGITFYLEAPTKIRQINRERNYFSRSCEKPKCITSSDQHNCFIDEQHNSNNLLTRTIYGTWFQQILCHSTILKIDTLCPISTLDQQLTNLEPIHIQCSLHCEGWSVKGSDCASALHFFNEITYQTDEWTKQLLRLKNWVIFGNPEQWMEFHRLWGTVIVFKCSYLLQSFDFYCLLEQPSLFFLNFTFSCSLSLMTLSEK